MAAISKNSVTNYIKTSLAKKLQHDLTGTRKQPSRIYRESDLHTACYYGNQLAEKIGEQLKRWKISLP